MKALLGVLLVLVAGVARAEEQPPVMETTVVFQCTGAAIPPAAPSKLTLPPSVILTKPAFQQINQEFMKRGQKVNELSTEKNELIKKLEEKDASTIKVALIMLGVGLAAGAGTVVALHLTK